MSEAAMASRGPPRDPALTLTALWTALGIALVVLFPLLTPGLLLLALAAPAAWFYAETGRLPQPAPSAAIILLGSIALYLAVNASWSASRGDAYRSVLLFVAIVFILNLGLRTLPAIGEAPRRAMAAGLLIGLFVGALFVAVEIWEKQAIRRAVMSAFPALRSDPRHMTTAGDAVTMLAPHLLNRHLTVLVLMFWPAAWIMSRSATRGRWLGAASLAATAAAVAGSVHATSKLALIGSAAVFGASHLAPSLTRRMVAVGFALATILVVPLSLLAHDLCAASWLPKSAQQRVVIWGATAAEVAKAPILGAGVANARALKDVWGAPREPCAEYPVSLGIHSHNGYLQVWYDTGAVGALLLLALGLVVLRALSQCAAQLQPYLYATFAACALMAASSFSIWQPWFLSALAFSALAAMLARVVPPPRSDAG